MKIKTLYISVLALILWIFSSCNSTGYEIEEVEDYSDSTVISSRNEIKQEVEQPKVEIKTDPVEKKSPEITESKIYIVQVGAFENEYNAAAFTNKIKNELNISISYKLINGLFKVRTVEFTRIDDAASLLSKIKESGYEDAFITDPRR